MARREYILDDGRKITYRLDERISRGTDTKYYVVDMSLYEKRPRWITLGLTKRWAHVESRLDTQVPYNSVDLRSRIEALRDSLLEEDGDPLEQALDSVLAEIKPNHSS